MKEEITDEQMIALLEGESNEELELKINSEPDLKKRFDELKEVMQAIEASHEVEIPAHIQGGFQQALIDEKIRSNSNSSQWSWMQIAAALALLILGFGMGKFATNDSSRELALLKDEIQSLREVTLTSRLQRHSASERIMAVNQIEQRSTINNELVSTLITTLNSDESPNVRYAALQALEKFIGNMDVRAELVKSLESQSDPLIQISLITILVDAEERSVIAPLKDMIEKEETSPEVKQQAQVAIQVLT
ncbi:HEAT repeat domain-containing protein [Ekhidna sp. To15]|uniref:HEAT repeat domain-containing protein n=1 Tax=Ekhidna sp. To15 TaxID=3395267 RepID=UPI003F525780